MIEIRGLQALQAVADYGTVTAAAATLGFTPSAVSQQIAHLARELNSELLTRQGRGVQLTHSARTLLARAEEISAQWEELRAQLAATADSPTGLLRICGVSSAIASLVAPAVAHLREAYPGMATLVREEESPECFRLLANDESDLAVVLPTPNAPASPDPRFEQQPLLDDPQDLLVPADHPLAARERIELGEAAHESWIATQRSNDTYALLTVACAAAGFTPQHRTRGQGVVRCLSARLGRGRRMPHSPNSAHPSRAPRRPHPSQWQDNSVAPLHHLCSPRQFRAPRDPQWTRSPEVRGTH